MRFQHNVHGYVAWAVLGFPYEKGVGVMASDSLTQVELQAVFDDLDDTFFDSRHRVMPIRCYAFGCKMDSIVMAYADTYPEALAKLFATWQPKADERWGLPPGQPMLPEG